jgi:hypothetical protein
MLPAWHPTTTLAKQYALTAERSVNPLMAEGY